ncbi:hypothetical protein BLOT_013469 [Blomia tropicalis]|nr:hypothetical protein BLOT_013469 [Blomia tropicalis]
MFNMEYKLSSSSKKSALQILSAYTRYIGIIFEPIDKTFLGFINTQMHKMQMKFDVQTIINLMCIHQVVWYHYFSCLILIYYQIATNYALKTMSNNLKVSQKIMNLEYFHQKLRTMSIVSEKFNDMIGFPIILYAFYNVATIIMTIIIFIDDEPMWTMAFNSFAMSSFNIYIIKLNYSNCCMVKTIFKQMLDEQMVRGRNRILRWSLIDLYYDSFQLRLFRLSQITFPFILSVTVFILNYVVLLLQTI